ncbi:ORF1 [Penicillium janczewskii chrysovirus 2]|uniref:RNA-directed RNA polymerase n=1 Tax=Penicillium janczewskii chrysovirus 2 TaxID=1755793 RepID=A0A0S2KPW5_9VIRU|nr:ORF1 [Penicillium janczewskii chrysovirus 2]ALO50149.1 ORF1 [Penicillium janczewskii chrysovirus 2]
MNTPTLGASYTRTPTGGNSTRLFASDNDAKLKEWEGLHAIVLPTCCGKSSAALRFGGYDIDDIVADASIDELDTELDAMLGAREDGVHGNDSSAMHRSNRLMLMRARRFFATVSPDDNPLVVYCHTAEFAQALGVPVGLVVHLDEEAVSNSIRMTRETTPEVRNVTLQVYREQTAANREFSRRHGLSSRDCYSYSDVQQCVWSALVRCAVLAPCRQGDEYHAMLDSRPQLSDVLNRSHAVVRTTSTPNWVRACAARQLKLSLGDLAPTEAHAAHSHPAWASIVHIVASQTGHVPEQAYASIPDWSEEEWREYFPLGPGNASFALVNVSDWLARTPSDALRSTAYSWFRQLLLVRGTKYERLLCMLVMGDVSHYVAPQYTELYSRIPLGLLSDVVYATISKQIHAAVRVGCNYLGQRIPSRDLTYFMYFDCLAGRVIGTEDIDAEIADRTRLQSPKKFCLGGEWSESEFDNRFTGAVQKAYDHLTQGLGAKLRAMTNVIDTFDHFMEERRTWVRPGAASGAPKADLMLEVPASQAEALDAISTDLGHMTVLILRRVRLNKSAVFEFPQFVDTVKEALRDYVPNSFTKYFFKFEPGKFASRALFPSHLLHYIMVSHVLFVAEKGGVIPETRLTAGPEAQQEDHWLWREMHDTAVHLMLDYANFNEQHSIKHMQATILGLKGVYSKHLSLTPDLARAIDWTVESFERICAEQDGKLVRFTHGLLSGWRCTTWVNSIANVAYLDVIRQQVQELTGRSVLVRTQSGGDDVAAEECSLYDAALTLRVGEVMGFEFKAIKQLISCEYREFFRLFITREGVYGSLCRMLGSALSGQWSNSVLPKLVEPATKLSSVVEIARKAGRRARNLNLMEKMALVAFDKWATTGEECLVDFYVHGTKETGGLGIPNVTGDLYVLDGSPDERPTHLKPVGHPSDASSVTAARIVDKAVSLVGPEAVLPTATVASTMAEGAFVSSIAQNLGPRALRVGGRRQSHKVVRVLRIREEDVAPGRTSADYQHSKLALRVQLDAMKRAGRRYAELAPAVKPAKKLDLARSVGASEGVGGDLLYYWQEEHVLYGCATYMLTEDYYEDVVLIGLLQRGRDRCAVANRCAELAMGLRNDGYMWY